MLAAVVAAAVDVLVLLGGARLGLFWMQLSRLLLLLLLFFVPLAVVLIFALAVGVPVVLLRYYWCLEKVNGPFRPPITLRKFTMHNPIHFQRTSLGYIR